MTGTRHRGITLTRTPRSAILSQVFGIASSVPNYTYVDRSSLDKTFKYFVNSEKHVVVYGASKQGKTILRKKNLPDIDCVVVQCRSSSTLEDIYAEVLRKLNVALPTSSAKTQTNISGSKGKGSVDIKPPFIFSAKLEAERNSSSQADDTTEYEIVGASLGDLGFISDSIKHGGKKVVIEDFHYLPEREKRRLAFDLKAFWDNSVFLIVVGVWSESNLLTYYNGDLSGRINEIDVRWTQKELESVLTQGEKALNIKFSDKIRQRMVFDASHNVGLLQRVAERLCYRSGITESQNRTNRTQVIQSYDTLAKCRKDICDEDKARYQQFCEAIGRGLRVSKNSQEIYARIVRACVETSDDSDLCMGIHRDHIYRAINDCPPELQVKAKSLDEALKNLNKLQLERKVSPLVFSYNSDSRKIQLVDLNLLFFRRYGNPDWPWKEGH
jgi:hypothetical protein